ncbi:MAG: alpha/beta fold hydrolase [Pirellulaceae bacterium]|nr:alpha/beta fold hydrolase [Pirellulaceae bacterium]
MADWRALYPFESRWLQLASPGQGSSAGGLRLHYIARSPANQAKVNPADVNPGPATDGLLPTILCVHGNPTWSFYYREVIKQQGDRARVVAVDNMGCGLSDKPQVYPYTLDQHISNLVTLIEQLDLQRITLVVHDWGGAIGLGAALAVPERISGLVILNTAAFPPPYIPLRIAACRLPFLGPWAMRSLNLFARAALSMTLNRLPRLADDVASGLIAPYDSWAHRVAIAGFVADIPTRPSQPTWQRLSTIEQTLPQLGDRPIELVWGMRDWCFRPECLSRFEQILPQAKVTRLDDVGHYVMEEAAVEVNAAIDRCLKAQTH